MTANLFLNALLASLAEPEPTTEQSDCEALDGYVLALEEFRDVISSLGIQSVNPDHVLGFDLALKTMQILISAKLETLGENDDVAAVVPTTR